MGMLLDDEYVKFNDLYKDCKDVDCFTFDGVIFLGEKVEVIKRYIKLRPSKSFYVWCHDNLTILNPSNNKK